MTRRAFLISGIFLLMSLLAMFWQQSESTRTQRSPTSTLEPDYVATKLHARTYNRKGQLHSEIAADKMEVYDNNTQRTFKHPHMQVINDINGGPWRVSAQRGSLLGKDQVQLQDKVMIESDNPMSQVQQIHTEFLAINLADNTMDTDRRVIAKGPQISLQGKGMHADLNRQEVTILNKVEATYDPK